EVDGDRGQGQGKEAATMRQAVFVVLMVGAAFLGGSMTNGPALRWAQGHLLDYLGLKDAEIASIDLPGSAPGASAESKDSRPSPTAAEPKAPVPSIASEKEGVSQSPSDPPAARPAQTSASPRNPRSKPAPRSDGKDQAPAKPGKASSESPSSS